MKEFEEVLAVMIGYLAFVPPSNEDVKEAAKRVFNHLVVEAATIREIEKIRAQEGSGR